ncbi:hypothetical protein K3G63_10885 [Hymenobacter sp. HSC-4F20]|uniref:hypothetical protein n=1 Tax=Hymenobacter sp. HSC-4F20 TaxID=2864135 RepID=UPI001C72D3D7|nr:hypothetical protein [Hymenobacter sp. HSC-4F20]MBX0290947.1 hypothetical protein [Hymenobacter sp. HSC-4F20]
MKNLSFLLLIAAVVAVGAILVLDYNVHGKATWWSHAAFWSAAAFVVLTVWRAFRNEAKARKRDLLPAVLILLLAGSGLLSCQRTPAPAAVELHTTQAGDTVRWATQSYEDAAGYTHTIPAGRAW